MALSLRQRHQDVIKRMLNLNQPVGAAGFADEGVYKILVYDKFCCDVLSPLIHLDELRKHGVTVHFMIDRERQNIPDAPAVYFVQPTAANIQRILSDASRGVYESLHLNFSSALPRSLVEELAAGALKNECTGRITKLFDQYAEFVTLERTLFSLAQPDAYLRLNDPASQERDIEATVESIVTRLLSVVVTLGVVPVICCARSGPAEMVGTSLSSRISDHLVSRNNLFTEAGHLGSSFQRPLLCIFDRGIDLAVALQHAWTYKPLVHDVLGMKLNRVVVRAESEKGAAKSYELDESDSFWSAHCSAPFPKIAEEVEAQLAKYKKDVAEVNRSRPAEEMLDEAELLGSTTKRLMSAVSSLPEMQERKKTIDKHTNIASALLGKIKERKLDAFHELEEEALAKGALDRSALLALIRGDKGTADDKLRLAVVCLLAAEPAAPTADVDALASALLDAGVDAAVLHYVRRLRSLSAPPQQLRPSLAGGGGGVGGAGNSGNIVDWLSTTVSAGVKNFLSAGRQLAVTRAVELLMDARAAAPELEPYLVLDPKAPKSSAAAVYNKGPFKDAIVFVVGGGSYLEHASLQELAQRSQPHKTIVYGSTEILSGSEFVQQLASLGQSMGS